MSGVGAEHMEGEIEAQGRRRDPLQANPPGNDRDLGTGLGRKSGEE